MDKTILKKFATESRKELMKKIKNKINMFYIDEEFNKEQKGDIYVLTNTRHTLSLTDEEFKKRELLIKRIKELSREQVIEEAAYTWFNRIIAIRYMEIHDYLPLTKDNQSLGIRVLSSKDNTPDPEILKFTNLMNPDLDIDFEKEKYVELKDDNEKFKYVLLLVCKKLGRVIPQVFDGVTDYIDILIPDNLLNDTGFVTKVINEVPENNYNQVEIIGWLYQYYISEKKDEVFNKIKNNQKVLTENIPAATQLFTPEWIVEYMVQNSLGKYWIEKSGAISLANNWKFYINTDEKYIKGKKVLPTDIKIIDPCCGSGHILVYTFEILFDIYMNCGYSKIQIPDLIIENNIFGLDIDERAVQLSILSIILKAREYSKDFFNSMAIKNIKIYTITNYQLSFNIELIQNEVLKNEIKQLVNSLKDARKIGSLLLLKTKKFDELIKKAECDTSILGYELRKNILPLVNVYKLLSSQYDIVITNPPYMSKRVYEKNLANYLEKNYPISKYDLYAAFIERNIKYFCKPNGYISMVTIHTWMFISMYESLRKYILENFEIETMIHTGANTFEELNSFNVLAVAFCIRKKLNSKHGKYIKLTEYHTPLQKIRNFKNEKNAYLINQRDFFSVVGQPFVYWMTNNERNIFKENKTIREYGDIKQGMATSDNRRFLRFWTEVDINKIGFNIKNNEEAINSGKKWFPYNKGGNYRKWYGNNELVVNWESNGKELKEFTAKLPQGTNVRIKSQEYYFKPGITWSLFGFENFGVRYKEQGYIFDISGSSMFFKNLDMAKIILTFLASKVAFHFLTYLAPTVNFQIKNVGDLPFIFPYKYKNELICLANENIKIVKEDWDFYETSWNFKRIEELMEYRLITNHIDKLLENNKMRYMSLKENEEKINNIYIDVYQLENLDNRVLERDISIRLIDKKEIVKEIISYAVGCMFGRYSLDKDGLIYAGGDFDKIYKKYKKEDGGWAGASLANYTVLNDNGKEIDLSFEVDNDNVIPITDEAYFGDDIVERFKKFISVVYGKETLNENLDFIAETLGKKGTETSEDTLRRYFVNDFFNDHVKTYQKRPIYWLFDSGKKNGFKALIYMHRYNENLVPKIRLDYLHRMQTTYEKLLSDINYKLTTELSMTDKKEAQKRQADLNAKLQEIKEYDEKIAHIANQRISIDLDDGVKVNYAKFQDILAKIK